jgi:hypothetical protein
MALRCFQQSNSKLSTINCLIITLEYDSSDLKENGTIPFYRRFFDRINKIQKLPARKLPEAMHIAFSLAPSQDSQDSEQNRLYSCEMIQKTEPKTPKLKRREVKIIVEQRGQSI